MRLTQSASDLRRANRNQVYRFLYDSQESRTVQDVAHALSMSLPTVNQNLNELMELGLVDNSRIAHSSGGRRPRILSIVPSARCAIGVEVSPRQMSLVAVDLGINELGWRTVFRAFETTDAYAAALAGEIRSFTEDFGLDRILGVGVTLPGIMNAEETLLEYAPTLVANPLPLNFLKVPLSYPMRFFNDASAGGFAEWWNRPERSSMAYLSLGRGVGGAILANGIPYEGERRRSAEFGHMCIHPGGKTCSCGRRGCLEAYCSTAVLSSRMPLADFFQDLNAGDREKARIWEQYLSDLSLGIVNIHTMLDCDVVLGGPMSLYLGQFMETLKSRVDGIDPFSSTFNYVRLCRYHDKANGIGAALKFIDGFLAEI